MADVAGLRKIRRAKPEAAVARHPAGNHSGNPRILRSASSVAAGLSVFQLKQTIGEASGIAPLTDPVLLDRLGAEAACWIVHDEPSPRNASSILALRDGRFAVTPLRIEFEGRTRLTDGESTFVRDGRVYVVGSGFIGANGSIDPRRAFVATFDEADVRLDRSGPRQTAAVYGTVKPLGLELTAAVNSALRDSGVAVAVPSKAARRAAKKAGLPGGVPVNVEGAAADDDGNIWLGLRSPVSAQGNPLMLKLAGDLAEGVGGVASAEVQVLDLGGTPEEPIGIRDLAFHDGRIHAIAAHADATMTAARRRRAIARHVSVDADEPWDVDGAVRLHRTFGKLSKVEGLARPEFGGGNRSDRWWYVVDDEKAVVVLRGS